MPRTQVAEKAKKVAPVMRRQIVDADEHVGKTNTRDLPAQGKARLESADLVVAEQPVSKEKLDALKFNEDVLTILVHDTTNPADEPIVEVWNDGTPQRFQRGKEQQVKRKYVEVLARAKNTTYTQRKLPDNAGYQNIPHTALRYPFSVVSDPNPRGAAWLKALLAQV